MSLRFNHRRHPGRKLDDVVEHGYAIRQAKQPMPRREAPVPSARLRFRIAHIALLGQGLALGILGGFALAWSMANLRFGPEGAPILGLTVTPCHGGLLLISGAVAVLACLSRWTTAAFCAIAAAGWLTLTVICAVEAERHAPGALGFDPTDTLVYAALGAYNLVLTACLVPVLLAKRRSRGGALSARSAAHP
jgi:hypothetical protein